MIGHKQSEPKISEGPKLKQLLWQLETVKQDEKKVVALGTMRIMVLEIERENREGP